MMRTAKKLFMTVVSSILLFGGIFAADSISPNQATAANGTVYETHGPFYRAIKGSSLKSAFPLTLHSKCKKAVEDYGKFQGYNNYIQDNTVYTCEYYNQIERRVTTIIGTVVRVSYSPLNNGKAPNNSNPD